MVLFDDVVEISVLPHQDVNTGVGLDTFNGGRVGAAFVDGDLFWYVVQVDGTLQKATSCSQIALGREQEVDSVARAMRTSRRVLLIRLCGNRA